MFNSITPGQRDSYSDSDRCIHSLNGNMMLLFIGVRLVRLQVRENTSFSVFSLRWFRTIQI
jgi:hypothetical protein